MSEYRTYLIENQQKRKFFGFSDNVRKAVELHNFGRTKWTAQDRPWTLVWMSKDMGKIAAGKLAELMERRREDTAALQEIMEKNGLTTVKKADGRS